MKKKIIWGLCFVLLLSSCTMNEKLVFDESVPLEDSAWISENNAGKITGYNGIPVDWNLGWTDTARIPAGDTLLEWNVNGPIVDINQGIYASNTKLIGEGIFFRFNFQPQMIYTFMITKVKDEYGFDVFAYGNEEKVSGSLKEMQEHWVGFVPFLNTGGNAGKTVLN